MNAPTESRGHEGSAKLAGVTLLDVGSFVFSAAVSAVHLRGTAGPAFTRGFGPLFWLTFVAVAFTAAGPFLFINRRFLRPVPGHPGTGDLYWLALGLPWVLTALLRAGAGGVRSARWTLYTVALCILLGAACVAVLAYHWVTWVRKESPREGHVAWTDRVGMVLGVAWPLQCGFALIVLSSP